MKLNKLFKIQNHTDPKGIHQPTENSDISSELKNLMPNRYLGHFFIEFLHRNSHFWSLHKIINKFHDFSTLGQMPHCASNSCKNELENHEILENFNIQMNKVSKLIHSSSLSNQSMVV